MKTKARSIRAIALEIRGIWKKVYFGAVPYLEAMLELDSMVDNYGADDAPSIVRYFLSNARGWRGDDARRIKAELTSMLKSAP